MIKHAVCPECGKPYAGDGVTRTISTKKTEMPDYGKEDEFGSVKK